MQFDEARKISRSLNLKSQKEWLGLYRDGNGPLNVPRNPWRTYEDCGWKSWGDWLGTGTVASYRKEFLSIKKAKKIVHKLGLRSAKEWSEFCSSKSRQVDIPSNPQQVYKNSGWNGWPDFLGKK